MDKLEHIFQLQKELNDRIGRHGTIPIEEELQSLVRAMIHELVELEDSTSWQWWRRYTTKEQAISYILGMMFGDISVSKKERHGSIQTTSKEWFEQILVPMVKTAEIPFSTSSIVRNIEIGKYKYPNTEFYILTLNACDLFDEYRKGITYCTNTYDKKYLLKALFDSDGSRLIRHREGREDVETRLYSKNREFLEEVSNILTQFGIHNIVSDHGSGMTRINMYKAGSIIFDKAIGFSHPKKTNIQTLFKIPDIQNIKVEIIDLMHFLLSMAIAIGLSGEDIYQAYLAKNKVNHIRQDSGYVEKDPDDCRHI